MPSKYVRRFKICSTVICLTVFFCGRAQITGTVTTVDENPIPGVVLLVDDKEIATTNNRGVFQVPDTLRLPLAVTLSHPGYFLKKETVTTNNQVFRLQKISENNELSTVLLASRYRKQSGMLVPTTTITQERLRQFDPVDAVDALNQTEGIYIQNGAINTNRITIRGVGSRTLFGTNKIRAYFNGIPITNGAGTTEIDSYNTDALASIEVVKGPKATQYGTNLGGTLILATKNRLKNGAEVANDFSVGSFGLLKNSTTLSLKEDALTLFANYDHLQLDGFRGNSWYNRNNYLVATTYAINEIVRLGLLLRHTNNVTQIPSSLGETAFREDPTQAAFTWAQAMGYEDNRETLAGLSLETTFSESFNNTTSLYYTYLDHYEPRPFNILEEFTHSYGFRSIFAKQYTVFGRNASLSFGSELYLDAYNGRMFENLYEENNGNGSLQGTLLSDNDETRRQLQVFATTILPLSSKWSIEAGLNVNSTQFELTDTFNTGEANTSDTRNFETILAPNFNLLYKPSSAFEVYGNVSRGFNYPSVAETLTPEGVVNPDIGPEIGWNYEVGATSSLFERRLQLSAAAYIISIDDLVVAERIGNDQFVGRNAGKTHNRGLEFGANATTEISPNLTLTSYATAEFNFHKFIDFVDGEEDFSGNELTGVPDKKIAGGIQLQHAEGIYVLGNLLHVGSQPITDANDLYSDSYTVLNLKAGYEKNLFEKIQLALSVGINNVADATYASSILINAAAFGGNEPRYFYPAPPINYFGSLRVSYTL